MKVIKAVPSDYRNDLYHTMDGYDWIYENSGYRKFDVIQPGFFDCYREELRVGAVIECRLGKIEDGIEQGWLQVIQAPQREREGTVMVSTGPWRKFTPVPQRIASQVADQLNEIDGRQLLKGAWDLIPRFGRKEDLQEALG